MAKWEDFYPYIQQYVAGCPKISVNIALKEATDEFCSKTYILKQEIEDEYLVKNIRDYDLPIPRGKRLQTIRNVSISGLPLKCFNTIGYEHPHPRKEKGRPFAYQIIQDRYICFYPTPEKKYTYDATMILSLCMDAKEIDDFIFRNYYQDIAYGAISILMQVPGTEPSNMEMSLFYRTKFDMAIDKARRRNYESVPLSVRPNPLVR